MCMMSYHWNGNVIDLRDHMSLCSLFVGAVSV